MPAGKLFGFYSGEGHRGIWIAIWRGIGMMAVLMNSSKTQKKVSRLSGKKIPESLTRLIARQSILFRETLAEREEILRHKWLLSERAGRDVGFDTAAYDWISHHRKAWRDAWRKRNRLVARSV